MGLASGNEVYYEGNFSRPDVAWPDGFHPDEPGAGVTLLSWDVWQGQETSGLIRRSASDQAQKVLGKLSAPADPHGPARAEAMRRLQRARQELASNRPPGEGTTYSTKWW